MSGVDDITVVIPAYNAGSTLGQVLSKTIKLIPGSQVIVVDDGSTDDTGEVAERYGVKMVHHKRNLGKGAALKSGFKAAMAMPQMRAAITMDADGQHAPEYVAEFIRVFRQMPVDLIIGCRQLRCPPMPLWRVISNRITSALLSWRIGVKILDSQSGYRLHSRRLLERITLHTNGYEMESELLLKTARSGMKIQFIPIATIYTGQKSHIRGFRDMWRFVRMWMTN